MYVRVDPYNSMSLSHFVYKCRFQPNGTLGAANMQQFTIHHQRDVARWRVHRPYLLVGAVCMFVCITGMAVPVRQQYTKTRNQYNFNERRYGNAMRARSSLSSISQKRRNISCFIITLNVSMQPVHISPVLTCYPYVGSRINDEMLAMTSDRVRANVLVGTSSWGADFSNNQSVSIAYNHIQLWHRLANSLDDSDMMIFEDDAVVNERPFAFYKQIQRSGVLPHSNYILKFANRYCMQWLGHAELESVYQYRFDAKIVTLEKCVCRTRQNFFGSLAYVLDRQAALVLLEHHLPLQVHIDMFMHYVGCRVSNFFVLDVDVVASTGRLSTHMSPTESFYRKWPDFKEQLRSFWLSTCY